MFNKYQQALNFFTRLPYRVPLKFANDEFCKKYDKNFALIKELVDKVTPKKPIQIRCEPEEKWDKEEVFYNCPNCGEPLPYDFDYDYQIKNKCCLECQQVLDWSDSDEKDNR